MIMDRHSVGYLRLVATSRGRAAARRVAAKSRNPELRKHLRIIEGGLLLPGNNETPAIYMDTEGDVFVYNF